MGRELFTTKQFLTAIKDSGGIVSTIADRIGCDWHTANKYIKSKATLQQAWQNEKEQITDIAETSLIESIKERDAWAVKYYLSTKGKNRGYTERQEITGADGGPLRIAGLEETAKQIWSKDPDTGN